MSAATTTRRRIIETADVLFYQQGFESTSFADIAAAVQISRGNFYHHFKSKDDILAAVIALRLERTRQMLADWQHQGDTPKQRIKCFIRILQINKMKIRHYGCPVGTLAVELAKLEHGARSLAVAIFSLFRDWLEQQFQALGRRADADQLAMQVLSWSQGIAVMFNAFKDEAYVNREVEKMCDWLDSLN